MGQREKILNLFFEEPRRYYQIREIANLTKIPKTTVSRILNQLLKEDIIKKKKHGVFYAYLSNETNFFYRFYKKIYSQEKIYKSGLIDYLEKNIHPRCIILFGSFAKSEYDNNSDIDIFIQSKEIKINLEKFEKKLKHQINLYFKEDINKLSNELFNNIINGIKLKGYIKLK